MTEKRKNLFYGIILFLCLLVGSAEVRSETLRETFSAPDKLAHTLGGVAVFSAGRMALMASGVHGWKADAGALVLTSVVAFSKEYMDSLDPENHTADPLDAAATIGGGLMALTVRIEF